MAGSDISKGPPSTPTTGTVCSSLYVCLSKEHRVSRTFRATWYLKNLNKPLASCVHQEEEDEEEGGVDIQVLGVCGGGNVVGPSTQIFYICQQYSLVFVVDMSPNMRAVSNSSYCVKLDQAVSCLCSCLTLLTQPFCVTDGATTCAPDLWVTVLGYCGGTKVKPIHVFVQGVHVDSTNCSQLVESLRVDINSHENHLSTASDASSDVAKNVEGGGDTTLDAMIKAGSLGIQLLPRYALKGLVLLTDGISGFPSSSSVHNTAATLSSSNISCWVVHVGGTPHSSDALGLVPDLETLNFITRACNGCVIQPDKVESAVVELGVAPLKVGVAAPNPVQRAVVLWSFQMSAYCSRVGGVVEGGWQPAEDPFAPIVHHLFHRASIIAPLLCVLGCKIREGFFLKDIQVKDLMVEVCLCYPWQPSVNIYYTVVGPWPVGTNEREELHVTIAYDGPYTFVHDIQQETNTQLFSSYRVSAVHKFKQALQKLTRSDAVLTHFLSFSSTPSAYTLPASVQDGIPLFHFLPGSTSGKPGLSIGINTPGGKSTPLHQFWRPLCTLDTSQWYRWFHSDKLVLVLRPESPLPKTLLQSSSGRYSSPLCRPAASHLFAFLKGWSSVVLRESDSYVRFLPSNENPHYFCFVRVAQKHPCLVLHVGYIEGTPHSFQAHALDKLACSLQQLSPPTKDRGNTSGSRRKGGRASVNLDKSMFIIGKQLQRMIIRYGCMGQNSALSLSGTESTDKLTQMEYLLCSSWKWLPPYRTPDILSALLECRLAEGYHLTSAHNGVVTLAAQLSVKQLDSPGQQTLLLQYVICAYGDGVAKRNLQSELWVEPQHGVVCDSPPGLGYLKGLTYDQISSKVHQEDCSLVIEVASYAHLLQSCQAGQPSLSTAVVEDGGETVYGAGVDVVDVMIEFQLSSLYSKSSVCVLTVTAFTEDLHAESALVLGNCSAVNNEFWKLLSSQLLQTVAPTAVPLVNPAPLMQRLRSSEKLQDLFLLVDFESTADSATWICGAVSADEVVTVLLLPKQFWHHAATGNTILPIVVLQYTQQLNPDPNASGPIDNSQHFDLVTSPVLSTMAASIKEVLTQLSFFHTSCYLQAMHFALTQHLPFCSQDYLTCLQVCKTSTLSVDLTPLLAGLCHHTRSDMLTSDVLCQLLTAALSKKVWSCSVARAEEVWPQEDSSYCNNSTQQVNATFRQHLLSVGFQGVPQCGPTHFWLDASTHIGPTNCRHQVTHPPLEPVTERSSDADSSDGEDGMFLEPLLSHEDLPEIPNVVTSTPPPLFLRVTCCLRDSEGGHLQDITLPDCTTTCLKTLTDSSDSHTVSVELIFSSLCVHQPHNSNTLSWLPHCYGNLATSIQSYLQWLICDELVSVGRFLPATLGLLQGVATHVQTTHQQNCLAQQIPLKFVFGESNSLTHFTQHLEAMEISGYQLHKLEDYYYFQQKVSPPSVGDFTPDLRSSHSDVRAPSELLNFSQSSEPVAMERSKTPPPPQLVPPSLRTHRRSLSSGYPLERFHVASFQPSLCGSDGDVEVGSGYEGGLSDSSFSEIKASPDAMATQAWLVLRVLSGQVGVYFQCRICEGVEGTQRGVCDQVIKALKLSCHRTNQWLLMKDMLETHICSPYLLSESASEAWVEEVVLQQTRAELFRAQEFKCDLVHSFHITPHWRIKERKAQAALLVTRAALSAFAVTNRKDLYVFQDIKATGEESIFYVKVDESLCNVEGTSGGAETSLDRRPVLDADETQSTFSYQQSILSELAEVERKNSSAQDMSPFEGGSVGKPQESLVLQVYGIDSPSQEFKERLSAIILLKLDSTALDLMCNAYSRNQQLKLTPEDVDFLQPDRKPSHTLHLTLPSWLSSQPFFFYFLQTLSTFANRPVYTSSGDKQHLQLQAHQELQNAYLMESISHTVHKDHMFLYIRPQTKGRGVAVLCVALADSSGKVQAPIPGAPQVEEASLDFGEDQLHCVVSEEPHSTGTDSIKIYVWEKGNIGLDEFMQKLCLCYQHAVMDYHLEISLLSCAVAFPWEEHDHWLGVEEGTTTPMECLDSPLHSPVKSPPITNTDVQQVDLTPKKKLSIVSFSTYTSSQHNSDNSSRRGSALGSESRRESVLGSESESESRRGSALGSESRRGSALGSESRRGSALGSESRRGSALGSESRQGSVFGSESSSRRSSLAVSEGRKISVEKGHNFGKEVIVELDEGRHSSCSSTEMLHQQVLELSTASPGGNNGENKVLWLQKEKLRRMNAEAALGKCGVLVDVYNTTLPKLLTLAHSKGSPSVKYVSIPLLGSYSSRGFLSQALVLLEDSCPGMNSDVFRCTPTHTGYTHYIPEKDWTKVKTHVPHVVAMEFIVLTRDIGQWEECHHGNSGCHSTIEPSPHQFFHALDSNKLLPHVLLQTIAEARHVVIPRKRLVLFRICEHKAQVWLYNMSDHTAKKISDQLNGLREHLAVRAGLLHHMLAQKMGLYRHCMGSDLSPYSKMAMDRCSTIRDVVRVIKNLELGNEPSQAMLGRRSEHISVDNMYQDQRPYGAVGMSLDPIFNHGKQFRAWLTQHHNELDRIHLLGKVFRSWQSREGDVPVNPAVIADLKKTTRLFHYCTSPLLLLRCMDTPISTAGSTWLEAIKQQLFTLYIDYLISLGFQIINERASVKVRAGKPSSPTPVVSPLYKCLQRSWAGGILMAEATCQHHHLLVTLYTLEGSRLQQSSPPSPEARSLFAEQCAHYKDLIHVHSFMYDFHLRILLDWLHGKVTFPLGFHPTKYLELCHTHYQPSPTSAQNLLKKGSLRVPTSVEPLLLYRHLLFHSKEFGTATIELAAADTASDPAAEDIGLLINISEESLISTPDLYTSIQDSEASYSVKVVALYSRPHPSADEVQYLRLEFYLLLVNTRDYFPCLLSPHVSSATSHTFPLAGPQEESDLNLKVREHLRKMGFGLSTLSVASQVLDEVKVQDQLRAVCTHLEAVVQEALHHMRKNELWKRMLYGVPHSNDGKTVALRNLMFNDFTDLLYLVKECPLDSMDPILAQLKKQPRKWFKKLIKALNLRFAENIRIYSSDDLSHTYAAIVNPDWQDMLVLLQHGSEGRHQAISAVYRKPTEVPQEERHITAHVEADRHHIETVVNFCCSFMWASILDSAPPLPQLNLL